MNHLGFNSGVATALCGALLLTAGCGFGLYDDTATPQQTSANNGVSGDGQWWPWACANGSMPSAPTTPLAYTATGTCVPGGALSLSVEGCNMVGDWSVFGLTNVTTNISTSIPAAGGWEIAGTGPAAAAWTCDATVAPSKELTLTCTAGDPAATVCVSTLAPVTAP